jgi:hypothetical protein
MEDSDTEIERLRKTNRVISWTKATKLISDCGNRGMPMRRELLNLTRADLFTTF